MMQAKSIRNTMIIFMTFKECGILLTSSIDKKDKTYNNYVDGKNKHK